MSIIPKIIFIVPYRNREQQKTHFSIYMKYIMEDYDINDYEIYYSHQTDVKPFNRGGTKNIGFLVIKEKYPNDYKNITFVFNDIDILPSKKNLLNYETTKGKVKHFYGFDFALGGVFSIIGEDFEKCGGFPNNWGWGLEDNEMQRKVLKNNILIDRNNFFVINSNDIIHLYDDPIRIINNREPQNYAINKMIDNLNTITELKYKIEKNIEHENLSKITHIIQNEYMINILFFKTLINPDKEIFYNQDILKEQKLKINLYEKTIQQNRWVFKFLNNNNNKINNKNKIFSNYYNLKK